ncbi:MAG: galactokinase [Thermoguttaceae bacterium]
MTSQLTTLAASARETFQRLYGRPATVVVAAPGRVNLIGEHTDYNDGFVFPMAIERFTVIAAAPSRGPNTTLRSIAFDDSATVLIDGTARPTEKVVWSSYVQGVLQFAFEAGVKVDPFDAVIVSDVPLGGGLSSSASLEVATATLLETLSGRRLDPAQKALLCQKAEHKFAHMPCGIMDQFISTMAEAGKAMLLDCRSRVPSMVPLDAPDVAVLIINSNVKHQLTGSEYPTRRRQCETAAKILGKPSLRDVTMPFLDQHRAAFASASDGEVCIRRARHVVTENDRTLAMADALREREWKRCGELMRESHVSMRDDFEISCPEIDILVDLANSTSGVWGSRMTGGGFGGCTVSLVESRLADEIASSVAAAYKNKTGIAPSAFVTRAACGAAVLQ